jgi:hypothetical protein
MIPRYSPPDSIPPEEISEDLADVIRDVIARSFPVCFPLPRTVSEFKSFAVRILTDPEVLEALGASGGSGRGNVNEHERETVARLVSEFIEAENPRMLAQCYDLAFRLGLQMGITQDAIAEQHGVTKAAVSKTYRRILGEYSLPPARGMKSNEAVETYREREKEKHRKRREEHRPWSFASDFLTAFTTARPSL